MSATAPHRANGERTRPIEIPPRRHIVHDTADGKQDPLAVLSIERLERPRRVCLLEQRRRVRIGHPLVIESFVRVYAVSLQICNI